MLQKKSRLLNEICDVGMLEEYRNVVDVLLEMIIKKGCRISIRYDVEYSNIVDAVDHGSHIRVSLKNVKDPLDIIWKLLHEYGHFLSGKTKSNTSILEREELAWRYADEIVKSFPELLAHKEAYNKCKELCLNTYREISSRIP